MPNPIRSYHCSGAVTLAGINKELALSPMDSTYLDITTNGPKTCLYFRMNQVDSGFLEIPDGALETKFAPLLQNGHQFNSLKTQLEGKLPTFTKSDDAAVHESGEYTVSLSQYGPGHTFALRLQARINHSTPPSIDYYLTPKQSHDLLTLLRDLAVGQTPTDSNKLVLVTGETITGELAPP